MKIIIIFFWLYKNNNFNQNYCGFQCFRYLINAYYLPYGKPRNGYQEANTNIYNIDNRIGIRIELHILTNDADCLCL